MICGLSLLADMLHLVLQEMAMATAILDPAMAMAMEMVREPPQSSVCILYAVDGSARNPNPVTEMA